MLIIVFYSQGIGHKEILPEGKTVNAEFYKEVMDRLLNRNQRVRPVAFCSRDFSSLHDNAPAHKTASVCQFLTQKMLQPFIIPYTIQFYLRQAIFCYPKLKIKLKELHSTLRILLRSKEP
jgi:hypothetical protein